VALGTEIVKLETLPRLDIKTEIQAIILVENKDMFNKNLLKKIAKGAVQAGEKIVKETAQVSGAIVDMTNLSESVKPVDNSQAEDEASTKDSAIVVTTDKPQTGNWWDGAFGAVAGAVGAVGNAASAVGGTVAGAAGNVGNAVGGAAGVVGGAVAGAAGNVGGAIVGYLDLSVVQSVERQWQPQEQFVVLWLVEFHQLLVAQDKQLRRLVIVR